MVGQHLDDPAFPNLAACALVEHGLNLRPEPRQPGDPVVDVGEVVPGDDVGLGAGPLGMGSEIEQRPDCIHLKPEIPRVSNEAQTSNRVFVVGPAIGLRPLRRGQQPDGFIEADGRDLHPCPLGQHADGE